MMVKRILVTGGAGFIGSHLCETLLAQGSHVICADNFFTGSRGNLAGMDVEIIEHDITEPLDIEVDEIYNFACPASPVHYQYDPIKTWKTSVLGVLNMLELAKRNNAKILHASTSEVYGDPLEHPQREDYWGNVNPIGVRSCYDEGKRAAETLMTDYHRQYGTDIRIVRIFNTYGPRMAENDGRVVSNFIVQALKGEDLTVYGDGLQTRSFCYVDDLVRGIVALMAKQGLYSPVNLGNNGEYTVLELAQMVLELTGSNSQVIYKPLPSDDPTQRRPDLTRAREELNYELTMPVRDGLTKTIEYFKKVAGLHP